MTCAIIDDEPLAVKLLEAYALKTPELQLLSTYSSAIEAYGGLRETPVDLIFCDIQMPDLDGLKFAQMLSGERTRIVFTTAFDQYALEGWKVDALDYLLKPIAYPDFLAAVQKAQRWFEREGQSAPAAPATSDSFFVKSDYKLVRVNFSDILYVEGVKDYVKIYLSGDRKSVLSLTSMRAIEGALPATSFLRVHRSYIVNMDQADVVERGQILLGDKSIPISDSYKDAVMAYVNDRMLQGR